MSTRKASCSCGQLQLITSGEPVRISICHCLACQRRTGSPFGQQARFPAERVRIGGQSHKYVRTGDSGTPIAYHFCPSCSSIVYYRIENEPELIAVPVGAFADPSFPEPRISVYGHRKHPWVVLPADIENES